MYNNKTIREVNDYIWDVTFPTIDNSKKNYVSLSAQLIQKEHSHDVLILKVKAANLTKGNRLTAGDPVEFFWGTKESNSTWYGYIYSIERRTDITNSSTRIVCVGLSFHMKNQSQRIMKNVTADKFAKKIAKVHGLKAKTSKHPRVFPMISQSGQSDWQMLSRLAAQCGYAFRVENGTLIFKSYKELYEESKRNAPYFLYVDTPSNALSALTQVYHFRPLISEKGADLDGASLRRNMTILDKKGNIKKTKHKPKYKKYKVSDSTVANFFSENPDPLFSKVITDEVSVSATYSKNVLSSMAIDQGYRYQAKAKIGGNPQIRPYNVIYIDGLVFYGYWVVMEVIHKFGSAMFYEVELTLGSDFLNEGYVQKKSSNTRELKVEDPKEINEGLIKYSLEDSRLLNKVGREISPGKNSYVGNPLDFYQIDYSTAMYNYFPPNFSQYSDTPKWRVK